MKLTEITQFVEACYTTLPLTLEVESATEGYVLKFLAVESFPDTQGGLVESAATIMTLYLRNTGEVYQINAHVLTKPLLQKLEQLQGVRVAIDTLNPLNEGGTVHDERR